MKTPQGIRVIEFNARFGDPETEVVLPRLKSDIYDIFSAVADGRDPGEAEWHDFATLGIVLASKGYPGSYEKGYEITGTEQRATARTTCSLLKGLSSSKEPPPLATITASTSEAEK